MLERANKQNSHKFIKRPVLMNLHKFVMHRKWYRAIITTLVWACALGHCKRHPLLRVYTCSK